MDIIHKVRQGEYLSLIASKYGFADWKIIYDHPKNKDFKKKRPNPNVIHPGDEIVIPKKDVKEETIQPGKKIKIKLKTKTLQLRITVKEENDKPLANVQYQLRYNQLVNGEIEPRTVEASTDADGLIDRLVPEGTSDARVIVTPDASLPERRLTWNLKIGELDPVEEISGSSARLNNLGYDAGYRNDPNDAQYKSAVEEFQCDHSLTVDGKCGPKTQAKLKEVYGC